MFKSIQRGEDLVLPKKKEAKKPTVVIKKGVATCLKNVDHRFSCHISTDKHQYKPEETVHVRGVILNEFSHMPAMKRLIGESFSFRIVGPSGAIVFGGDNVATPSHQKSVVAYDWKIPENIPGGCYKIEIGKKFYDKGEMLQDEKACEEEEEEQEGEDSDEFDLYPGTSAYVNIEGETITRQGRNGWHCLVRKKVVKDVQKFKFKIEQSASDKSGIFIGCVGANIRKQDIWKSCCLNDIWGNVETGSTYELEIDQKNRQCKFWKNGQYLGVNNRKMKGFKLPLYAGVFMHYQNCRVTFTGESKGGFFPVATRKFDILKYTPPKFKLDLEFQKKGYGPGNTVQAIINIERREGGKPPSCQIEASSRLDGKEIFRKSYVTKTGSQFIEFKLPEEILEGNGSLNVAVTEGITESTSKTIPILLRKIDCKVYPEGGDIIMGVPNGVYVEAKTLYGSPAQFEGFLIEKDLLNPQNVRPIVEVKTVHEGRGSFQFTPQPNKEYVIKVLKPDGITVPIKLPEIKNVGMTIRLMDRKSVEFGRNIQVGLAATRTIETRLGLYKKDKIIDITEPITIKQGEEKVFNLNPKDVDGVLRLTAFFVSPDFGLTELQYPVCERLIMVKPKQVLDLEIESKKLIYCPGEKVNLRVIPKIEGGQKPLPIPSVVLVTVTDDSVHQMLERRKRAPRLIEQVYLENEVKELKDCTAYLSQEIGPQNDYKITPDVACDLLLGTQGWRRFIYVVQQKNPKFFEDEKYKSVISEVEFFYRMLNLPNPEYFERKKAAKLEIIENDYSSSDTDSECEGEEELDCDDSDDDFAEDFAEDTAVLRSIIPRRAELTAVKSVSSSRKKGKRSSPKIVDRLVMGGRAKSSKKDSKPMRIIRRKEAEEEKEAKPRPAMKKKKQLLPARPPVPSQVMMELSKDDVADINDDMGISFGDIDDDMECEEDEIDLSYELERALRRERRKKKKEERMKKKLLIPSVEYAREYAYTPRPEKPKGVRDDFTETVLFSPYRETIMDPKSGQYVADFEFHVSDSITSFIVKVDAFSMDGMIGSSQSFKVTSQKPFFLTPKLPLEVSMADEVCVPVGIVNNLPIDAECKLSWTSKGTQMTFRNPEWKGKIGKSERKVEYFDMKIDGAYVSQQKQSLTCKGELPQYMITDEVSHSVSVQPYGFLTCIPFSGVLKDDEEIVLPFEIDPKTFVKGSIETVGNVVPSSLGSLMTAVKGMIREPWGCFEQVSSTMYPMILSKQFLMDQQEKIDPKTERFLKKGYDKLMGYEISGGGFDWYGSPPANESLSAMGLAQFIELEKVFSVDPGVIGRTKNWLLSRMTKDGFMRSSGRYAYGHAKETTTNAYILWAISRTKLVQFSEVESVMKAVHQKGVTMPNRKNDNYVTALLSIAYYNFGKPEEANALAQLLIAEQKEDGSLGNCLDTITRSGGRNRTLECSALACQAWQRLGAAYQSQVAQAIDFIMKNNRSGCYGSTQSTVLCLQAIIAHFGGQQDSDGVVEFEVNGSSKRVIDIPKYQSKPVEFENFGQSIKTDGTENKIIIRNRYGKQLPYSIAVWFKLTIPPAEQETLPFRFSTSMGSNRMKEGDISEINIELTNLYTTLDEKKEPLDLPMIIAIVAIPSGLTPRMERLKELQKMGIFDYFELFGARNVVFYWRGMAPSEVKKFSFEVSAKIPGKFIGDASRAYLYYDNDIKFYMKGLEVTIDPNKT